MKAKRRAELKKRNEIKETAIIADDFTCQSPFCEKKTEILGVHSLEPPKHEDLDHLITLCRACHTKCEEGFKKMVTVIRASGNIVSETVRVTGLDHEIAILEYIKENRSEHFRHERILEILKRKRRV